MVRSSRNWGGVVEGLGVEGNGWMVMDTLNGSDGIERDYVVAWEWVAFVGGDSDGVRLEGE